MPLSNPSVLSSATRLQPANYRTHSRSRSRSPERKSQFTIREIDPLLGNLSPDSTLKALQATATITSGSSGQDALARSIAEATPAEREIGIRAAVAAQKLREWHQETKQWPWPARRDRGWGAGFLPPSQKAADSTSGIEDVPYLGFLPAARTKEYQARIEDIRDGIEALELEEVKDHIFSAHVPQRSVSAPQPLQNSTDTKNLAYGRMRDFTALITATVIQALPELANLTILLDTWDVRLSVLRQIPDVTQAFRSTRAGVETAYSIVRNPETGPLVTMVEFDTTKSILGDKVASLGQRIDKLLDLLEGQEDSLPKIWIDSLEHIENQYATWVVEAEHIAIRNDLLTRTLSEQQIGASRDESQPSKSAETTKPELSKRAEQPTMQQVAVDNSEITTPLAELPSNGIRSDSTGLSDRRGSDASRTLPAKLSVPHQGHTRGQSEISMADSMYSVASDISAAEIVDVKSTQVLMSPRISVVENPMRASRNDLLLFPAPGTGPTLDSYRSIRPPVFQRASTASIEVVNRNSVRQVNLTRSRSHDMLSQITPLGSQLNDPSQALRQLNGADARYSPPFGHSGHSGPGSASSNNSDTTTSSGAVASTAISPTPSLRVNPLQLKGRPPGPGMVDTPELPRRSSKRNSRNLPLEPEQSRQIEAMNALDESDEYFPPQPDNNVPPTQVVPQYNESLETKINNILSAMPNKVRLVGESDAEEAFQSNSTSSTRSTTPVPTLTLAPAKTDRSSKQAAPGDIRVFHLTKSGQSRDTQPVKLYVRAVGENGERIMVRVGGGWADLAEYLREYSLHHGHRGLNGANLEVARIPNGQSGAPKMSNLPAVVSTVDANTNLVNPSPVATRRRSLPGSLVESDGLPSLTVGKVRNNGQAVGNSNGSNLSLANKWNTPPVPPIPTTFTIQSPTTVITTINGRTRTSMINPSNLTSQSDRRVFSSPVTMSTSTSGASSSTATKSTTPVNGSSNATYSYIPLGAAGPRPNPQRPVLSTTSSRESWVQGMVGRARALSGSSTTVRGPTSTTTTTIFSKSTPNGRRVSAFTKSSSTENVTPVGLDDMRPKTSHSPERPKSRIGLGDVSSIRRVFLRKKRDK